MTESSSNSDEGGDALEVPSDEAYPAVYGAVRDALFDAVGTVLLLGLALLFVAVGVRNFLAGSHGIEFVLTDVLLGIGLVLAAVAFDLVPSFHERLVR